MLIYSKLYDILTGKSTTLGKPAFKNTIQELFLKEGFLKYIYFTTENNIPCLLSISEKHEITVDNEKCQALLKWEDKSTNLDDILTIDFENNISVVKELKIDLSPNGFKDLLKRLSPSLITVPYKVAIMTPYYLLIINDDDEIDIFRISGPDEPIILLVINLEYFIFKSNNIEIKKVYDGINKIIQDSNDCYWDSLLLLLKKCQQLKIITNGKMLSVSNNITRNIKINMSYKAIKSALDCFEK